ncbi:hypothetical protein Bbelb_386060 [Branchiostoma belcheri]|nr:hypothetical protein Bbelb_386060 [Branchiostoma belcheri]
MRVPHSSDEASWTSTEPSNAAKRLEVDMVSSAQGNQNSNFRLATRPGDFPLLACFRSTQFECLTDGTDMEDRVKRVFKDVWGFEVRPDQLKAVLAALEGKDVFVGMAAGKGKSLCFQSIPLCLTELVVVVSPLRALVRRAGHPCKTISAPSSQIAENRGTGRDFNTFLKELLLPLSFAVATRGRGWRGIFISESLNFSSKIIL